MTISVLVISYVILNQVMPKRNKSIFEKWFSLSRHRRRLGAENLSQGIDLNFKAQRSILIEGNEVVYTYGSSNSLNEHFVALRKEFSGQSELCLTHAKIIVLIRREFKTKNNFQIFNKLWEQESKFLLKNLNLRWLIAAADTFIDHSSNDVTRSLSLACVCLFNSVKLQESEHFATKANVSEFDKEIMKRLESGERIPLFDGTEVFKYGTGDFLRNMRWRIEKLSKVDLAGAILLEIFKRFQDQDTAYKRAKNVHIRKNTQWW